MGPSDVAYSSYAAVSSQSIQKTSIRVSYLMLIVQICDTVQMMKNHNVLGDLSFHFTLDIAWKLKKSSGA